MYPTLSKGTVTFLRDCPFFVPRDIVSALFFGISYQKTQGNWVKAKRRILIYGNSVILGTIGACLRRCSGFDVTTLKTPLPDAQVLDDTKPDILLFDLEVPHSEAVFSLLKTNPNLHLIGVSPGINQVDVWSGRQLREISMQGLLEIIKGAATDLKAAPKVGRDG